MSKEALKMLSDEGADKREKLYFLFNNSGYRKTTFDDFLEVYSLTAEKYERVTEENFNKVLNKKTEQQAKQKYVYILYFCYEDCCIVLNTGVVFYAYDNKKALERAEIITNSNEFGVNDIKVYYENDDIKISDGMILTYQFEGNTVYRGDFISLINFEYKKYFEKTQKFLKFEIVSYGIEEINL